MPGCAGAGLWAYVPYLVEFVKTKAKTPIWIRYGLNHDFGQSTYAAECQHRMDLSSLRLPTDSKGDKTPVIN